MAPASGAATQGLTMTADSTPISATEAMRLAEGFTEADVRILVLDLAGGLDTDADAALLRADGSAHARLHAIGSLRIGTLWESLAIPELRVQAQAAAVNAQ